MSITGKYLTVDIPQIGNLVSAPMTEGMIDDVCNFIVNLPAELRNAQKRMRIVRMRQKRHDCKRKRETLKAQRWNHNAKLYASGKLPGYPIRDEKRIKDIMKEAKRVDTAVDDESLFDGQDYDENYMEYVAWLEEQKFKASQEMDERLEDELYPYDGWEDLMHEAMF